MQSLPFAKPGRFWKGNLHMHSTLSDGELSPEAACHAYREAGYDFVSLTDHFLERYDYPLADTRAFRSENFTTILGAELHTGYIASGDLWHILAVGLPLDFTPPAPAETGPQIAARALDAGAFVGVAHPSWYALSEADILSLGPVHAVEVFNGVADTHNDRGDSWPALNVLLDRGHRYFAYAADDTHFRPHYDDFCRGWVWVKSESLDPDSLLAALKEGAFYASTGPAIHDIAIAPGETLTVRCSPAQQVFLTGRGSKAAFCVGAGLTEAVFKLDQWQSPYCRVTVRDKHGGRAWSNPIWLSA